MLVEKRKDAVFPHVQWQIGLLGPGLSQVDSEIVSTVRVFRDYTGIFKPWTAETGLQEMQ